MRALTSLHVGENDIPEKEMREIFMLSMRMDSMKILCGVPFKDKTLTELDVSGKNLGTEGALVITEYLDGNGALSKIVFGGDGEVVNGDGMAMVPAKPATLEIGMTKADLSNKNLGAGGAIIISAWIAHKDNGALTKLIFGGDNDHDGNIYAPATLEVGMTEADLSNKNLGVGGATIVAAWISHKDNGALTNLNISDNSLADYDGDMSGKMREHVFGLLVR
jgi:hypothetical protein